MLHAKLQAAVQLDTGLYVVERKALCNFSECVHAFWERPSQASASSSWSRCAMSLCEGCVMQLLQDCITLHKAL